MQRNNFLNTKYPLIQAPMVGFQNSNLAVAVSRSGAMGSLPAARLSLQDLDSTLANIDKLDLPYNVNFFCHSENSIATSSEIIWLDKIKHFYEELGIRQPRKLIPEIQAFNSETAYILKSYSPSIVSFHFGLPDESLLETVRSCGAKVISTATTLDEAKWLEDRGVDAIIAQGLEAGWHRGHFLDKDLSKELPLKRLIRLFVNNTSKPVIAAGGLSTASDIAEIMECGASAVQLGTAFLLSKEAITPEIHKHRLTNPLERTSLTNIFSGAVGRVLPNRITKDLGALVQDAPPFPWAASVIEPLRIAAELLGLDDFTPLWCGSNRKSMLELPAAEIINILSEGFILRNKPAKAL